MSNLVYFAQRVQVFGRTNLLQNNLAVVVLNVHLKDYWQARAG